MRWLFTASVVLASSTAVRAHDLESTRVILSLTVDGGFVLDISHNPDWLLLRLESFAGGSVPAGITTAARDARLHQLGQVMIERVVLWVDGREIRPDSAEYLPADATYRLRGRLPLDATGLRWLYGPVADPYPFIVRRADGRLIVEMIEGSNWSGTFDLRGQFRVTRVAGVDHTVWLVGCFLSILLWRARRLVS
jgi:hypothetical protein